MSTGLQPELDPLEPSGMESMIALFWVFFVLVVVAGIATAVWRVRAARRLARQAGLDEGDAAGVALLSEGGLDAAYLASALRQGGAADAPLPAGEDERGDVAARLRRLDGLRADGLITDEEWADRRRAILETI